MATAAIGNLSSFKEGDDWSQYVERLQFYFQVNGITEDVQKRATFLLVAGPAVYKQLSSLITPAKPADLPFERILEALTKYYSPRPSEIVERFKFHSRVRKSGESVSAFVSELRSMSKFCNFGATLEDMLRDRLVCGINEEHIQKRLLSEPNLTLQRAVELSESLETAAKNAQELRSAKPSQETVLPGEVHTVGPPKRPAERPELTCYRCGKKGHTATKCRFKDAKCHHCGKVGHLQSVCRSKAKSNSKPARDRQRVSVRQVTEQEDEEYPLFAVQSARTKPWVITVDVEGQSLEMEVDTGASLSLISVETHRRLLSHKQLKESHVKAYTYSGQPIQVMGTLDVDVCYDGQQALLPLAVVQGDGPSLLGRDWLQQIRLDWKGIFQMETSPLESLLQRKKALFQPGLGTLKGFKAKIHVDPTATPKFCKARPVSYAFRGKVEEELERLTKEGIVEPVQFADWAAPIVPVLKSDKESLRLCGDYKLTVNQAAKLDQYPIPRVEDLFSALSGGKSFSKLDMSQAYQQIELDEESKQFVVVNTHKGLFRYNRLPFGVSSAPAIFQRVMESLLQGLSGVVVYLDDILVTGRTEEEHLSRLEEVLTRLEQAGLRLKRSKCQFMVSSVVYLGHKVDSEGLHPNPDKVKAVVEAPRPSNVTELKSFLGLLTYYGRFLPNLSTTLAPLYALLREGTPWKWSRSANEAFLAAKELLTSSDVLVHFDPEMDLLLACDASAYGVGAVLSHKMPDGSERPIAFASRTLTKVERKYSQIEREGLACIFGVKKFHTYLFGKRFTLQTDHKALISLFSECKSISPQASGRIQRWALALAMYEYEIAFKPTEAHSNADAMSRLPLPDQPISTPLPAETVCMVEGLSQSPVSAYQIKRWTRKDPVLSQVLRFVDKGWPDKCPSDKEMKPFWFRREELSMLDGCVLWGSRVVVPLPGQKLLLQELHAGHQGMARMKSLARTFFWWPHLDSEIEAMVKACEKCQQSRGLPPQAPLNPWSWPNRPWSRLHLDFAGPLENRMFLVLIDAYSKWIEVFPMAGATSAATIQELRTTFARWGLPDTVVTDNGPCFTSEEFETFLSRNGIRHVKTAPYHPASNGLAERAVQVFKTSFKKMREGTVADRLARVLFSYRITPHSTTGLSPAQLLCGRNLHSRLDFVLPDPTARVEAQLQRQKESHDQHSRTHKFSVNDQVYAHNFRSGQAWLPGSILKASGPVSLVVRLSDGREWTRHQDHIRKRLDTSTETECVPEGSSLLQGLFTEDDIAMQAESDPVSAPSPTQTSPGSTSVSPSSQPTVPRYPTRVRVPPDRYGY